jgi:TonB-dependent receptor
MTLVHRAAGRDRTAVNRRALLLGSVLLCGGVPQAAAFAQAAPATPVDQVVVTAPRQETTARLVQQTAPNLITVQSAEAIEKYPDFNAAEALGRLPGVSLSTDTGEGRFVNIRGIDGNLDGATFGGVPLLNTYPGGTYFSGGGRAVEFDTIPEGSIDGLIVTYTGLPDHEAEGLGGSVELSPRTAAHITKPFVDLTVGGGYEPQHEHAGPYNLDLAMGVRFGFDNGHVVVDGVGDQPAPRAGFFSNPTPFALVITGSSREDRRGFDDIEEDYNNPGTSDRSYQDLQFRRYNYHRVRTGYGGEFDFTPNEDHHYYVRLNEAGYTESVRKNRLTYDFSNDDGAPGDDPVQIPMGSGYEGFADMSVKSTDEEETHTNRVYVVGGQDRFDEVVLDYRASYSSASYDQSRNIGTTWNGPTGVATVYNNSGRNGDFPQIAVVDGTNINDPSLYTLSKGKVSDGQEHDRDEEWAYAFNLLFPVHFLNGDDRIKVGAEVRERVKTQNVFAESDKLGALSLANASTAAITDFYDNGYSNGPQVNIGEIRSLALPLDGPIAPAFDPTQYFKAREDIYAGYAQYTATVGKVGVLAGVRVEATDAHYGNYVFDGNGDMLGFAVAPHHYVNVFPTVQFRYDFTSKLVLRATYSTGIGRPGFNQIAGAITVDQSNGIITQGNPNLKPTTGNNFDVFLEYYLPMGGIMQFGAFDKEFSNYIVERQSEEATDPRIPGYGSPIKLQSFANVSSAYARGIQGAYHQQFQWLPDPFNGLGIEGNITLVDSRFQEYDAATSSTGHAEYGLLPGTSRMTANFAGFYEAHGVEARLSGEFVSKELFSLGGSKASDTIQDNRLTLDFASAYAVTRNLKIYFNAKNLLNTPLRFYVGSPNFPIQREFYGVTYEGGVKLHF